MKITLEQFETQWAENNLSVTDWFDTTYELFKELEALQSRSCDGCIREEEDMQDPHCAFCSRVCNDNYEAKEQL